ncbi:hypothetical protein CL657_03390 [bacterium]|nr:hypothetical protein [bacterium]
MKHLLNFIAITIFIIISPLSAYEQQIHVHGKAEASLILTQTEAVIEVRIPAISILGFEHSPQSTQEQQLLQRVSKSLKETPLFTFIHQKGWLKKNEILTTRLSENTVNLVVNNKKNHNQHGNSRDHHEHNYHNNHQGHDHSLHTPSLEETHAEIIIKKHYVFDSNKSINNLDIHLLDNVPDLHELNLMLISNDRQINYTISRDNSMVKLNPI